MLEVGGLRLDPATRQAWRGDERDRRCRAKEFALLEAFMRRPGDVLSRLDLLEHAWDFGYENRSNVIDVYVRYLREKVDRPFGVTASRRCAARATGCARTGARAEPAADPHPAHACVRRRDGRVLVAVGLFVYSRVGSDLTSALDRSLRSARGRPRRDRRAAGRAPRRDPHRACGAATRASRR